MPDDWTARIVPSLEDIAAMALAARAGLPAAYRPATAEVSQRIEVFAPEAILDEMEIRDSFGLTGLYDGIPLTKNPLWISLTVPTRSGFSMARSSTNGMIAATSTSALLSRMSTCMNSRIISAGPTTPSPPSVGLIR